MIELIRWTGIILWIAAFLNEIFIPFGDWSALATFFLALVGIICIAAANYIEKIELKK